MGLFLRGSRKETWLFHILKWLRNVYSVIPCIAVGFLWWNDTSKGMDHTGVFGVVEPISQLPNTWTSISQLQINASEKPTHTFPLKLHSYACQDVEE